MSIIFITDVFHTIPGANSIIVDLHRQFFADGKIFELERLNICLTYLYELICLTYLTNLYEYL